MVFISIPLILIVPGDRFPKKAVGPKRFQNQTEYFPISGTHALVVDPLV